MMAEHGFGGTSCPDSITMSMVLNPKVAADVRKKFVEVEASGGPARGATFVDDLGVLKKRPNASVVYAASQQLFREMLFRMLRGEGL